MKYELKTAAFGSRCFSEAAVFRNPAAQRCQMLGGQAAQLRLEGPAEGTHVGKAAGPADIRQGQVGIPHHQAGLVNADGVDKMPEVHMHPVREEMGQVGRADAQGPGGAFQRKALAGMFGYANDLRNISSGRASFSMEFAQYEQLNAATQEEVLKKLAAKRAAEEAAK